MQWPFPCLFSFRMQKKKGREGIQKIYFILIGIRSWHSSSGDHDCKPNGYHAKEKINNARRNKKRAFILIGIPSWHFLSGSTKTMQKKRKEKKRMIRDKGIKG